MAVAVRTPRPVGAEPRCAGCQALSLHRAGGQKCVQGPRAQGWGSAGSGVPLSSLRSSTDASSKVGWKDAMAWGGHSWPSPLGTGW